VRCPVKGASCEVTPILVSIYQAYKPKNDKIRDTDIDMYDPSFGGGFVPPGADAKAEPVVAARMAAENASERKVRDMIKAPGADALKRSVTKVRRIGIEELPECR
jgi:hypothetical protein